MSYMSYMSYFLFIHDKPWHLGHKPSHEITNATTNCLCNRR
jgi:hypothetical protein